VRSCICACCFDSRTTLFAVQFQANYWNFQAQYSGCEEYFSLAELEIKIGSRLNSSDSVHVCNKATATKDDSRLTTAGPIQVEKSRRRYAIILASGQAFGWRRGRRSSVVCRRPQLQVTKRPVIDASFYFCFFPWNWRWR
jgi:hypothetical protein